MLSKKAAIGLISLIVIAWIMIVVVSGLGWNPLEGAWSFANTGAFGDSFGPLSSIMAGLAAYAAFETLSEQRVELARIRERERAEELRREEEERDRRDRQDIKDLADRRSLFEGTFFNLLNAFRDISKDTDVGVGDSRRTSRDAFQRMCTALVTSHRTNRNLQASWEYVANHYKNDLNHYFRFLYHLVNFVDSEQNIDRYFYIRLVRASLSESELVLLFANCAVGEGREKFGPLVERYALLHNVSAASRSGWKMDEHFPVSAFEHP